MKLNRNNMLMAVLILLMLPLSASATNVSIGSASVLPNASVTLPLMINNVTDVGAANIDLIYNSSVVQVTSVTNGQFETTIPNINNTTGVTTIGAIQIMNPGLNGNVKLADVTLKAVGSAGQSSSLNLSITTLKTATPPLQVIPADLVNGTFTIIDLTPPASISNLQNTTGNFWINWSWNNPPDPDFSRTMVYINGTFITNTSNNFYNATYAPHATRKISTHTVDTSGNMNTTWVNQTTTIPNNLPALTPIGDKIVDENQNLFIDVDAADADGDALTYSTNRTDLFTDFNSNTGRGNWTPSFVQAGIYYVKFTVSDGFGTVSETVKITVNNVNSPPSITSVTADKTTVVRNETFTVTVTASDPDIEPLTYQFDWENNGTWSLNQSSNTASHSYPTAGNYNINVRVWDIYSANATNSSLVIKVKEDITPPSVTNPSANPSEILMEEANNFDYAHMSTRLNVTATDPNGTSSVTINLSSIGGSAVQPMSNIGGDVYSVTTNATGLPGSKLLRVNATDIYDNSNTSVSISLKVTRNGDVNGDGAVDIADAMWLVKNRVGLPGFPINALASDVNEDGAINIGDVMYLAKYTLHLSGFEKLY